MARYEKKALLIIYKFIYKSGVGAISKEDDVTATWSVEKYVENTEESDVKTNAKKIDKDPDSITVLVNKENSIDKDYKPDDLVEPNIKFSFNYKDEKRKMRKEAANNLELLFQGARYYGYELLSGFRSYERQKEIYEYNLIKNGFDYTQIYSAMPGTSEHQTGLAMDITCPSLKGVLSDSFGETEEGKWVAKNCYKYGFIVRYQKNKSNITGYGYEPWHIRYVGYDLAKYLYDNDLTLDEYYNYKLDLNMVNREAYAYYDYLLTMKAGGYGSKILDVALDDVLDKKNVDMSNSEPVESENENEEDTVLNPGDMFENFQTKTPTQIPSVTKTPATEAPILIKPTEKPVVSTPVPTPAVTGESDNKQTSTPDGDSNS